MIKQLTMLGILAAACSPPPRATRPAETVALPVAAPDGGVSRHEASATPREPGRPKLCDEQAKTSTPAKDSFGICPRMKLASSDRVATECLPTPSGAWALRPSSTRRSPCSVSDPPPGCEETHVDWELVHVAKDLKVTIVTRGTVTDGNVGLPGGHESSVSIAGLFDYDGDGEPEAILSERSQDHVAQTRRTLSIWKRGGALIDRELGVLGIADVDCDGRPDLLVPGPCECTTGDDYVRPAAMCPDLAAVLHARSNGSFADDEISRAVRPVCPAR
jgi:hypothetical protein